MCVLRTRSQQGGGVPAPALSVLKGDRGGRKELIDEGRRLIFLKGTDAHDYKFSVSVMEDAAFISPEWRDQFLAASVFWLKGSDTPDSPLVKRTRAAAGVVAIG